MYSKLDESKQAKLNMDKTEFLIMGSPYNLKSQPSLTLMFGTAKIKHVKSIRYLGVIMDADGLCRTLNYQLRNNARIR